MPKSKSIWQNRKKINALQVRKVLVFLIFVLISTFFWFLYGLSKQREVEFVLPVSYRNIPEQYAVTNSLPAELRVRVKDVGMNLLLAGFDTVDIDLAQGFQDNRKSFIISLNDLQDGVEKKISKSSVIQKITPENIEVKFKQRHQKKLPVRLSENLRFARQYVLKDRIVITPDSVTVFAPLSTLEKMTAVYTVPLNLPALDKSTEIDINLQLVEDVHFRPQKIHLSIPVELSTEKTLEVPVIGINFPANVQLRTFPVLVKVSFWVGLSRFEAIKPEDFKVYLDYKQISNHNIRQKLLFATTLTDVYNIKLLPEEVEYIMEEKFSAQ